MSTTVKAAIASPILNFINTRRLTENFLKIVKVNSVSDSTKEETNQVPSTEGQRELATILSHDLQAIHGVVDVEVDKTAVVTATLPTNIKSDTGIPTIGLLAHLDVSEDGVKLADTINPELHGNYQGGDLLLGHGTVIPKEDLKGHVGEDVITSDGSTLLGADDKAGIAEILEVLRVYSEHPELQRPNIRIAFTPDEEIGRGMDFFDIKKFGADAAYTIDGSIPGEIENETFNAHEVTVTFKGMDVHPGYAKDKMINSIRMLSDFISLLPKDEAPETTEGREGYIHPYLVEEPSVNGASISILVRDFEYEGSQRRIALIEKIAREIKALYPGSSVEVKVKESYKNMKSYLANCPQAVEHARKGIEATGLTISDKPCRGGTDGSSLSVMGLPTPNLGAGGRNFHSVREFVTVQDMQQCAAVVINTLSEWAKG